MNYFKLQISNGATKENHVDEVIADNRITTGNEHGKGFVELVKPNDIVMVHKGNMPYCLVQVNQKITKNTSIKGVSFGNDYRVNVLSFYKDIQANRAVFPKNYKTGPNGTFTHLKENSNTLAIVKKWFQYITNNNAVKEIKDIFQHKKQIILQGPPGTGKTRLAKQIANALSGKNYSKLEIENIKNGLSIGQKIDGASGQPAYYAIEKMNESNVVLTSKNTKDEGHYAKFKKIIDYYQELVQGTEVKAFGSHDSYELAVAKHFFYINNKDNYKLIQFHPSYTYEDFVRGISVKSGDNGLEYLTENKVLAKIAKEAYNNYLDSKKDSSEITKENWLEDQFELFKDSIEDEIEINGSYLLSDNIGIQQIGKRYFKYVGNGWHDYIKYSDFLLLFETETFDRQGIKKLLNIGSRSSYYTKLAEKFNAFLQTKSEPEQSNQIVELKKYVLIIDEINRANLSSVLGELIYALEYRGEVVNSMYDLNNTDDPEQSDTEIILPPNLYIIGTMNTADRSVGQIDYAIRRRFAFVDVLPKILDNAELEKEGKKFAKTSFEKVTELFIENNDVDKPSIHLSEEFKPKDVWLGHSYFILDKEGDFSINLEYEIKPILREYIADGILKESARDVINGLSATND